MKVSEAIDQLKTGDEVWVRGVVDVVYQGLHPSINIRKVGWFSENTEISLTEPKNEKVEVPSMIDKFIKYHADPIFEICAWSDHYGNDGRTCDDPELSVVLDWYGNNTTEFYEAVVNGYTVKPKRWVVKDKERHSVYINGLTITPAVSRSTICGKENACMFDDKSKAEAVATLVEGSVEEV